MALVFYDGFDFYSASSAAQLTSRGWTFPQNSMIAGRFGTGQAMSTGTQAVTHALPSTYATLIEGVAVSRTANNMDLFDMLTAALGTVATVGVNSTGKAIVKNSSGTVIATGTRTLPVGYNYFELKVFVNGASGTCELWVNGVQEIASTTGNFGSTNIGALKLRDGVGLSFDDLYVVDTTGSAPQNTFLGDVRVETRWASGAGSHAQWTPNTGANYAATDETTPNDDTDYVSDSTVGDYDTYAWQDLPSGLTVFAVQINLWARKDDANARQICPVIRQGGVDYDGTSVPLGSSYGFITQMYTLDPLGATWTVTNFNADEFGVKDAA